MSPGAARQQPAQLRVRKPRRAEISAFRWSGRVYGRDATAKVIPLLHKSRVVEENECRAGLATDKIVEAARRKVPTFGEPLRTPLRFARSNQGWRLALLLSAKACCRMRNSLEDPGEPDRLAEGADRTLPHPFEGRQGHCRRAGGGVGPSLLAARACRGGAGDVAGDQLGPRPRSGRRPRPSGECSGPSERRRARADNDPGLGLNQARLRRVTLYPVGRQGPEP